MLYIEVAIKLVSYPDSPHEKGSLAFNGRFLVFFTLLVLNLEPPIRFEQ